MFVFFMEKQLFATREELEDLKREVDSLKSTFEIMQDGEMMKNIEESERNRKEGRDVKKLVV